MEYRQPRVLSKAEAEAILASGSPFAVCEALVSLALNEPDWAWTQERCLELGRNPDPGIRAAAATCLGHVARIHRKLDFARVRSLLIELMADERTRGNAQNAASDIKIFMGLEL